MAGDEHVQRGEINAGIVDVGVERVRRADAAVYFKEIVLAAGRRGVVERQHRCVIDASVGGRAPFGRCCRTRGSCPMSPSRSSPFLARDRREGAVAIKQAGGSADAGRADGEI